MNAAHLCSYFAPTTARITIKLTKKWEEHSKKFANCARMCVRCEKTSTT